MSLQSPAIFLQDQDLTLLQSILAAHLQGWRVVVFGSRANFTARPYSDLDLCLMGQGPLPLETLADLRDELTESDLPIRVDLVDWFDLSPEFREVISAEGKEIQF